MSVITCAKCETVIVLIPDGKIRYCDCKLLGVDHTKEYTRYIGTIPKEDIGFEKWWEEKGKICLQYKTRGVGKGIF